MQHKCEKDANKYVYEINFLNIMIQIGLISLYLIIME